MIIVNFRFSERERERERKESEREREREIDEIEEKGKENKIGSERSILG